MPRITPIIKVCEICKKQFSTIKIKLRTCSKICKCVLIRNNAIRYYSNESSREKTSQAVKLAMYSPSVRRNFLSGMKIRRSYKKEGHPRWGVVLTQETKKKISDGNKGRFKGQTWEQMYGVKNANKRRKSVSKKMAETNSRLLNDRTSKLENGFKKYLKSLGYKQNKQLSKYTVDYLNEDKKRVIEIHGDYWHCNPKLYKESYFNKSIGMTAKQKWDYDFNRQKHLEDLGYSVQILWESDIKNKHFDLKSIIST